MLSTTLLYSASSLLYIRCLPFIFGGRGSRSSSGAGTIVITVLSVRNNNTHCFTIEDDNDDDDAGNKMV